MSTLDEIAARDADWDDHPQMHLGEVNSPDMALAYALQTHLCYSYIRPGDLAFRVLTERLASVGYEVRGLTEGSDRT